MTEALLRIPSRTVQYGYVEIKVEGDFGSSPEILAAHYINYVYAFQKEEQAAISRLKDAPQKPSAAPQGAAQSEVDRVIDETLKAAQILAEGLGGATVVESVRSVEEIMSDEDVDTVAEARKIQGQEVAGKAPWDAKVEAKPKPWQTDGW